MIILVHANNDYITSMSVYLPISCLDITYCNIRNGSCPYGYDYYIFLVIWYPVDAGPMQVTVEMRLSFLHALTDLCIRSGSKRSSAHPKKDPKIICYCSYGR
jgi:hypothetical protein